MSPVSRILDVLSLLSVPQTVWLFAAIALIVVARVIVTRNTHRRRLSVRLLFGLTAVLLAVAALEGAAAIMPRPMASLAVSDPDVVRIDFHSHTSGSKDANQSFSPANNRDWHSSGGFDVAYISDHVTFGGAADAIRYNPSKAGAGLTVLSAVEGRYHRILSVVMLGLTVNDTAVLDGKGHLLRLPSSGRIPVTIVAIPNGNIDSVTTQSLDSLPHFVAMELVDAAPRGLGQLDREETKIRRIAAANHLVLVSASNNHGWGRTVAAWNLMTISGWRDLAPDSLAQAIEQPFRDHRVEAVTIVKRLRPRTHGASLPLTLPVAAYQILGSLTLPERGVWLIWIWAITIITPLLLHRPVSASRTA